MITITHFPHPPNPDAEEMFVLRAESDLWGKALQDRVGDIDMFETAALLFSYGLHPQYRRHWHLVASDVEEPTCEDDVVGVASIDLPMVDNPRLATLSVVVCEDRRRGGIGSALHDAALRLAREHGRSSIQSYTWEPRAVSGRELVAETGSGSVDADSPGARFLAAHGYVLGQVERLSRLEVHDVNQDIARRDTALKNKNGMYEVITIRNDVPVRLFAGIAELYAAMAADTPSGAMDHAEEFWDEDRVRASMEEVKAADREQLLTFVRHIPSQRLVAFTRFFRDMAQPAVAHQWETLVVGEHRGHGLGMLMKVVNHAAVGEFWPEVRRFITGNAIENSHMRSINDVLGYAPYAASGIWERRLRGTDL